MSRCEEQCSEEELPHGQGWLGGAPGVGARLLLERGAVHPVPGADPHPSRPVSVAGATDGSCCQAAAAFGGRLTWEGEEKGSAQD